MYLFLVNKSCVWLQGFKLSASKWIHECMYSPWRLIGSCELLHYFFLGVENLHFLWYSILTLTPKSISGGMNTKPAVKTELQNSALLYLQKISNSSLLAQSNPIVPWIETFWLFNVFPSQVLLCILLRCTGRHIFNN